MKWEPSLEQRGPEAEDAINQRAAKETPSAPLIVLSTFSVYSPHIKNLSAYGFLNTVESAS